MVCRRRRGFTFVELLIAVMLIDLGLLTIVGAAAFVTRRASELRIRERAQQSAANRIELLVSGRCQGVSGAADAAGGAAEFWTAEARPNAIRLLRDSVAFTLRGSERSIVAQSRQPCR